MSVFIFDDYSFDASSGVARFRYRFDDGRAFEEIVEYSLRNDAYDQDILDRVLRLAFLVVGTSYAKTFPTNTTQLPFPIDEWTATFLNHIYQEGLSQFAYENHLTRQDLPFFIATGEGKRALNYGGEGILALQSGGKDSLLVAQLLRKNTLPFTPWYSTSKQGVYPHILDTFEQPLVTVVRSIDHGALRLAASQGAKNGHVPVTYIIQSLALIQAVLLGKNTVLTAIAHEGEEPHARIGDLAVTHQWSKTWPAEQLFAEYCKKYISPSLSIGSPLRKYSELRVAELFVEYAWSEYGHDFSSCNQANYQQGADNTTLKWCGQCPKCANSYLLFAPYVAAVDLQSLFGGKDLFAEELLEDTFKGLLGVDGIMKPFECIGEVDELRRAYHLSRAQDGYHSLPFSVPTSEFDSYYQYPCQDGLAL